MIAAHPLLWQVASLWDEVQGREGTHSHTNWASVTVVSYFHENKALFTQ